jgi:hypothetical protein
MKSRSSFKLVLTSVIILCAQGAASALAADTRIGCRDIARPAKGTAVMVAPSMTYNGAPMQVMELRTPLDVQEVLDFYRREWGATRMRYREEDAQGWRIISTWDMPCFYSVQVKADTKGSLALLGVTRAPERASMRARGSGFPMLPQSTVYNELGHDDGIKKGRTVILSNRYSPVANADFYRESFAREGWKISGQHPVPAREGSGYLLLLKRGLEEQTVTISRQGDQTRVVANYVDKP